MQCTHTHVAREANSYQLQKLPKHGILHPHTSRSRNNYVHSIPHKAHHAHRMSLRMRIHTQVWYFTQHTSHSRNECLCAFVQAQSAACVVPLGLGEALLLGAPRALDAHRRARVHEEVRAAAKVLALHREEEEETTAVATRGQRLSHKLSVLTERRDIENHGNENAKAKAIKNYKPFTTRVAELDPGNRVPHRCRYIESHTTM